MRSTSRRLLKSRLILIFGFTYPVGFFSCNKPLEERWGRIEADEKKSKEKKKGSVVFSVRGWRSGGVNGKGDGP